MKLGWLSNKEVQLNLHVIISLKDGIKGASKKIGLSNIIGWNIVWRRVGLIASIVIFLEMVKMMTSLVMRPLQELALSNGRIPT